MSQIGGGQTASPLSALRSGLDEGERGAFSEFMPLTNHERKKKEILEDKMIPVETGVPGFLKMYPVLLTLCTTPKTAAVQGAQDSIPFYSQTPCVQPPISRGVPNNPRYSVPHSGTPSTVPMYPSTDTIFSPGHTQYSHRHVSSIVWSRIL